MTEKLLKPEDQMMQWITSKWITRPLHVVAELGIADLLQEKPLSVEELAQKTDTHPPTLYRILRALSAVGVFAEIDDYVFDLTPLSQCLRSENMRSLALMFLSDWHDKAWQGLTHSVRTGSPGFEYVHGKNAYDWLEENSEARDILDQGQGIKALGFAKAVIQAYDFSDFESLCDIGGGRGTFIREILAANPYLNGIVADLSEAMPAAQKEISYFGLQNRCTAISCDIFKEAPPSCDAYLLVNVLHNWDDQNCRLILENLKRAMRANAKLLIVEYLLEPGPGFSVAKLLDLEMLVMGSGRERQLVEYKTLLSLVGLELEKIITNDQGPAVMECVREK